VPEPADHNEVSLSAILRIVEHGQRHPNGSIRNVAFALWEEGLLVPEAVDGYWGRRKREAYAAWQRELGFQGDDADGIPGERSLRELCRRHGFGYIDEPGTPLPDTGERAPSPVPDHEVSFPYGVRNPRYEAGFHTGDDYAAPTGTPVVAVRAGRIEWSDGAGGAYGEWVGLAADNGRTYVYCHLSERSVGAGDSVRAGERLGAVGATGQVTGPHLHFEDRPRGGGYGEVREPSW